MKKPETLEQIKRSIVDIQKQIDERGDLRVSLGLPESRPANFVETDHAFAIVERVKVVQHVLTEYLKIIRDGKRLMPFPSNTFDNYIGLLSLLTYTKDSLLFRYADLLLNAINLIDDDQATYERVVTRLFERLGYAQDSLELAQVASTSDDVPVFSGTDAELDEIIAGYMDHYTNVVAPQVAHEKEVMDKYEKQKGIEYK